MKKEFQLDYQFNRDDSEIDYERGTVKGIMTRFGQETQDMRNLVLMPGCFDECLTTIKKVSWFKNHNLDLQLGKWTDMETDPSDMYGMGKLVLKIEEARNELALLEEDAIEALSIGFGVEDYSDRNVEYEEDTDRILVHRAYLTECSTVNRPAMAGSKITEYFSVELNKMDKKEIRIALKMIGLTRSQVNAVIKMKETGQEVVRDEEEQLFSLSDFYKALKEELRK